MGCGEDCSFSFPREGRRGRGYYTYLIRDRFIRNYEVFFPGDMIEHRIWGVSGLRGGDYLSCRLRKMTIDGKEGIPVEKEWK